ncbi:MAG: class I SAM-dependent methyltransferase, partial [Chloroflexi bacterium]|nr:class I SAM-dependent methyltransferase [Chloroflexota bacterium]
LPPSAVGFDLGCGSGRWAKFVAPRVGMLHCVDASADALAVARRNLASAGNCCFHHASVDELPFASGSMDFAYALGVLHHVPDTHAGLRACVHTLKPGAPLLLYLYYAFDNRPWWFRALWRVSDVYRRVLVRWPSGVRLFLTTIIAALVYLPLARVARLIESFGLSVEWMPLAAYRHSSFYTMCTDSLDRFGTRLEQRFTAAEIQQLMTEAGLEDIQLSSRAPYWCAVGYKRA